MPGSWALSWTLDTGQLPSAWQILLSVRRPLKESAIRNPEDTKKWNACEKLVSKGLSPWQLRKMPRG